MNSTTEPIAAPRVSVILAVRNEADNLESCLRSLVVQHGVDFEILIVDDDSSDQTRTVAESFTRVRRCPYIALNQHLLDVRLISLSDLLPEGWTGKARALAAGEAEARGEWLLFTDADTEHLEGSLAAALAEAEQNAVDLLSYWGQPMAETLEQKQVAALFSAELAACYRPRRIADPARSDAAAAGQYLLARASVHRQLGGFARIPGELAGGLALARLYKQSGHRLRFRPGHERLGVRMSAAPDGGGESWIKNLALLFPDAARLAMRRRADYFSLLTTLLICLFVSLTFAVRARSPLPPLVVTSLWVFTITKFGYFYLRVGRGGSPLVDTLLSPFGLLRFAELLRSSAQAHQSGWISWRGRNYPVPAGAETHPAASNSK